MVLNSLRLWAPRHLLSPAMGAFRTNRAWRVLVVFWWGGVNTRSLNRFILTKLCVTGRAHSLLYEGESRNSQIFLAEGPSGPSGGVSNSQIGLTLLVTFPWGCLTSVFASFLYSSWGVGTGWVACLLSVLTTEGQMSPSLVFFGWNRLQLVKDTHKYGEQQGNKLRKYKKPKAWLISKV